MKKLTLLFLITQFCQNLAFSYTTLDEIDLIHSKTAQCINETFSKKGDLINCTREGIKKYDSEIKKTLTEAKTNLEINQYNQLLKTQKSWENYLINFSKLYTISKDNFLNKHEFDLYYYQNGYDLYKERITELSIFLNNSKVFLNSCKKY